MITYTVPDRFFEGQILWCQITLNGSDIMLLCKVLSVKEKRCEIKFLNSDDTCVWVDKDVLAEIRQRIA